MSWSTIPNYRLADAYINNAIDEKDKGRNMNPFTQSYIFNGNGLRGSDNEFKHKIREILAQPDYNQIKSEPIETVTDKIDLRDEYIQDRFDEQKHDMLVRQRDSLNDKAYDDNCKNQSINPYVPTLPVIQPCMVKRISSPLDSILTTTVLVIIGILLCYLFIRALFPVEVPETKQVVGNMNLNEMINEIEQNDAEN